MKTEVPAKRYATVDGERTACFVVGEKVDGPKKELVLCLPYQAEHTGTWTAFNAETVDGPVVAVRFTLVPVLKA
jgi:hypothetical protein